MAVVAACCLLTACQGLQQVTGTVASPSASPTPSVAGQVATPSWAVPVVHSGKRLGRVGDDRVVIDVEQVAVAKSPVDSIMVDPADGTPVVRKGSEIVLVRYIVTNVSSAPINLGLGTVSISARYPDWSWEQPLVSVRADSLNRANGVVTTPFAPGTARPPYVLGPGESFMVGANYPYETAEQLDVTAKVVVCDTSGAVDPGLGWTITGNVHLN